MRSISRKQEAAQPQTLGTSLMDLVRAKIDHVVLAGLRRARHKLLELLRLSLEHLLAREIAVFAIGDAQQAVVGDLRYHWEVLWADEEVGALPAVLF